MDMDEIVKFLETATHPEIYHYRRGLHPGVGWWLKTICPDPSCERMEGVELTHSWIALTKTNAVILTEVAFDWQGNVIPHMWSVWLKESIDVKDWKIISYDLSMQSKIEILKTLNVDDKICYLLSNHGKIKHKLRIVNESD
ncbi:MAG: hypothetical protein WC284_09490 [Candidimonas sp.]